MDRTTFLNHRIYAHQLEGAGIDVVALSLAMHLRFLRKENPASSELLALPSRRSVSDHHHPNAPQCNHIPVEDHYLIAVAPRLKIGCVSLLTLFAPLALTKSSGFSKNGKREDLTRNLMETHRISAKISAVHDGYIGTHPALARSVV